MLLPRFELTVTAGGPAALSGRPLAIAPARPTGGLGAVSGAAEAYGVRRGMRLGEAFARCPELDLLAPDPVAVAEAWERVLCALEDIGAGVEPHHPGHASFDVKPLVGLDRGSRERVCDAVRAAIATPARIALAASPFTAYAAARETRTRRTLVVEGDPRAFLATRPVTLLATSAGTAGLCAPLEQLGITTLGELAAISRPALADRFGAAGSQAHTLACGEDPPPRPRVVPVVLREALELPDACGGLQLERAVAILVDRLLARPERKQRPIRAMTVSATLVAGGSWRARVTFREALTEGQRIGLALTPRLAELPAPAAALALDVEGFGDGFADQRALLDEDAVRRRARLRDAVAQARCAGGQNAALRVIELDPRSRLPERRATLTPFEL